MKKNQAAALVCGIVAVGLTATGARAQPNLRTPACQSALQDLANQWNLLGLPTPPDHVGGIQSKGSASIRGRDGYVTSLANYQYMAIEMNAAAYACRAGNNEGAMEHVALVRDRLEPSSH